MSKKKKTSTLARAIKLFIVYTFTFITIFFFLDLYDFYMYNPYWLVIISIVLGLGGTIIHLKKRTHSRVDDLADKL